LGLVADFSYGDHECRNKEGFHGSPSGRARVDH
jgi:hypothetical protein